VHTATQVSTATVFVTTWVAMLILFVIWYLDVPRNVSLGQAGDLPRSRRQARQNSSATTETRQRSSVPNTGRWIGGCSVAKQSA
jgi:hypothetical protein